MEDALRDTYSLNSQYRGRSHLGFLLTRRKVIGILKRFCELCLACLRVSAIRL